VPSQTFLMPANVPSLLEFLGSEHLDAPHLHYPEVVADPPTVAQRQALTEQIRKDVTAMATEVLREEHETKQRLSAAHVKCISLMVLALVAVGFAMYYLRGILVPFFLAVFFMFLLEPILFALLRPTLILTACQIEEPGSSDPLPDPGTIFDLGPSEPSESSQPMTFREWSEKMWILFCVTACVFVLILSVGLVIYFGIQAVSAVDWVKYSKSKNWQLIIEWFPQLSSAEDQTLRAERVVQWLLQGTLYSALDLTISFISGAFLFALFLVILLFNDAMAVETRGFANFGRKVRMSVRRYIRIKTVAAFFVAVVCGLIYGLLKVDLWFLFAVSTFVLCFIPHVGYTTAVLAPLPIVFLDPDKTVSDLVICFALPFVIHQLTSNLIEPKLLASSLDLHPIIVLLSIGFWGLIWGAVGAILSVPLTAVLRMVLLESAHPYALPIAQLFKIESPSHGASRLHEVAATEGAHPMKLSPRIGQD